MPTQDEVRQAAQKALDTASPEELAGTKALWDAHRAALGGVSSVSGAPLPDWEGCNVVAKGAHLAMYRHVRDAEDAKQAERIKAQEPEVLRRVERAIANGAPAHTVAWIVTNSILRGLESMPEDGEVTDAQGRVWNAFSGRWVEKGAKGPAINWNPATGA